MTTDWPYDHYDEAVRDAVVDHESNTFTVNQLNEMYRETGIIQKDTLKRRVKRLVKRGPFEPAGPGQYRYIGEP